MGINPMQKAPQHDFYHWHCQAFTQHIRSANQQVPVLNHFKGSNKHIFNF